MKRIAIVLLLALALVLGFSSPTSSAACRVDGSTGLGVTTTAQQSGSQLVQVVVQLTSTNTSARFDGCPCESCDGIKIECGASEVDNQVLGAGLAYVLINAASPGSYTVGVKIKTTTAPFYGSQPQKVVYRYRLDVPTWNGSSRSVGVTFLGFDCE
jgi:hypothetical protein